MVDFSDIHLNPRRFNIEFENDVRSHTHDLNPDQLNAAKHAGVSAVIADFANPFVAREFGVLNEVAQDIWDLSDGAPAVSDDTRDDFNNAIGRGIQDAYPGLSAAEYYRGIGELAQAGQLVTDPLFVVDFEGHPRLRQRHYFKQRRQAVENAIEYAKEHGIFGPAQPIDHIEDKAKSSKLYASPNPQAVPATSSARQAAAHRTLVDGLATTGVRSDSGGTVAPSMDVPLPRVRPRGSGRGAPPNPAPSPYRPGSVDVLTPKRQPGSPVLPLPMNAPLLTVRPPAHRAPVRLPAPAPRPANISARPMISFHHANGQSSPPYSGPKKQIFDFVLRELLNPAPGPK